MGRAPCCDKANVKKGPWSPEEDAKLKEYMEKYGTGGNWIALPQKAGLKRCGKSCRLRWLNYLRPNIKHGDFSEEEDRIIFTLYANIGSRWSIIAAQLPGRTDNDIKNYWNTKLKKKAIAMGLVSSPQRTSTLHQARFLQSSSTTTYNSYYSTPARSVTSLEQVSFTNTSPPAATTGGTFFHPQESFLGSMFMTRGEASCSSSDESTNNIKISQINEYGNDPASDDLSMYMCNDGVGENKKFMLGNGDVVGFTSVDDQKLTTEMWGDNPFDYGIEDIKQLVSIDNSCNTTFLFDGNKVEDRVTYYY